MKHSNGRPTMSLKKLLVLASVLTLAACASPQVRFHTLMPAPEPQAESDRSANISVTSVTVPAQVDRTELVVRKKASELVVLSSDWWGASLGEELRSALVAGFGPGGTEAPRVELQLQIIRFDFVPGEQAWLEARYRVTALDGEDNRRLSCSARLRTAVSDAEGQMVSSLVLAQQENLQELIGQILTAASGLAAGRACPSD